MKNLSLILVFTLSIAMTACQLKEMRAESLIKEKLFETLHDKNSYSPIETIVTEAKESAYTDTTSWNTAILFVEGALVGGLDNEWLEPMNFLLRERVKELNPEKVIGWEVYHRFKCKDKFGGQSILEHRYVIDKEFKRILISEDVNSDKFKTMRVWITKVLSNKL